MRSACSQSEAPWGRAKGSAEEQEKACSWKQTQRTWLGPSKTREPGKVENPKKSILSDFILERN